MIIMENKVLIKLFVPELDTNFELFIPVNVTIYNIKELVIKSIPDIINFNFDAKSNYILINKCTSRIYSNNEIVINTDIRNASELILLKNGE